MAKTDHLYMPKDHMDELYNSKNHLVKYVHKNRIKQIIKCIPKKTKLKILDAGCGEGHLISSLHRKSPNNSYYGYDVSKEALKSAKKRCPYSKINKMDLSDIKTENNYFNIIICTEVLEHIYEYRIILKEFQRVLKKKGLLIITFPNEALWTISSLILGRRPIKVPDHVNSFTPRIMRSEIKMKLVKQKNLPFGLPFFISLGGLMVFKKI